MSPPRDAFVERLARALLAKAERSTTRRRVRLRIDADLAPELFARTDADEVRRFEALLQELGACEWMTLRLEPARPFQTLADRKPTLELTDFDALAGWVGYTRRRDEWPRRFARHLRERSLARESWQLIGGGRPS